MATGIFNDGENAEESLGSNASSSLSLSDTNSININTGFSSTTPYNKFLTLDTNTGGIGTNEQQYFFARLAATSFGLPNTDFAIGNYDGVNFNPLQAFDYTDKTIGIGLVKNWQVKTHNNVLDDGNGNLVVANTLNTCMVRLENLPQIPSSGSPDGSISLVNGHLYYSNGTEWQSMLSLDTLPSATTSNQGLVMLSALPVIGGQATAVSTSDPVYLNISRGRYVTAGSGIKVASGNNQQLVELLPATTNVLGGVKIGSGIDLAPDGTISVTMSQMDHAVQSTGDTMTGQLALGGGAVLPYGQTLINNGTIFGGTINPSHFSVSTSLTIGSGTNSIMFDTSGLKQDANRSIPAFVPWENGLIVQSASNLNQDTNTTFSVSTNDVNTLFDVKNNGYVASINNVLDDGNGQVGFLGAIKVINNTQTSGNYGVSSVTSDASDVPLSSSNPMIIASFIPQKQGNFVIYIYYRVTNAPTNLSIKATWSDGGGQATETIVEGLQNIGRYSVLPYYINATTSSPITVTATADTANRVYVSTTIEGK